MTIEDELAKLEEEVAELKEAIVQYDNVDYVVEELADVNVVVSNLYNLLINKYGFSEEELNYMCSYKKARTERRFREGYYEKQYIEDSDVESKSVETIF